MALPQKKLEGIQQRYQSLGKELADPNIYQDIKKYREKAQEYSSLGKVYELFSEHKKINHQIEQNKVLEKEDQELQELVSVENAKLEKYLIELEENIKLNLLPKDINDKKNAVIEIRAGTGGQEAALFVRNLYDMYRRFAELRGWKSELISLTESERHGLKEVIFFLKGKGVYSIMKYESGVHRVQRVPQTESQGRVHTSASSVAVLPEAEAVDVPIIPEDIEITTCRSSGAGGQHVNKTDSAVRVVHIPTGMMVYCQEERSQFQNKEKALQLLRSRLYEQEQLRQSKDRARERKSQVSTGDRSAKIRTYNFAQSRITDHRINYVSYNLEAVLKGELTQLIEALQIHKRLDQIEAL